MKKVLAFTATLAAVLLPWASPASATGVAVESDCLTGWYVNPDEGGSDPNQGDRRPSQEVGGLKFVGNQLVHHVVEDPLTVADLEYGTFVASPAPNQDSFFSVEVWNDDLSGYATLRWDTTTDEWIMVTGGQLYTHEDPAVLVTLSPSAKSAHVRTFGVGYTNNPNNGTETVVSLITFMGHEYHLTCQPEETPSPEPTVTATADPTPSATTGTPAPSTSVTKSPVVAGPSLPVTGNPVWPILVGGAALLALGIAGLFATRDRRKRKFQA